jgi:thiol-disulfide isomerase/thioredoxin
MKTLLKPYLSILAISLSLLAINTHAKQLKPGDDAPNFIVTTLSGEKITLSELKGNKPVYLKFWATWCSYCKVELPHLQSIYDQYGGDIEVIAINVGISDAIANIGKLYSENGYKLPTVFDQKGTVTNSFGVIGTPHHILIDREGKIAYRTFLATDQLDQQIEDWSQQNLANNKLPTISSHITTRTKK